MWCNQLCIKSRVARPLGMILWSLALCGAQVQAAPLIHATNQLASFSTSKDLDTAGMSATDHTYSSTDQCDQPSIMVADNDGSFLIGRIDPSRDLQVGDKVTVKVYDKYNRILPEELVLTIASPEQGKAKQWAFQLAYNINHQFAGLRAGQKNEKGGVTPKYSCNLVYASQYSTVGHLETVFTLADQNLADVQTVDNVTPVSLANSTLQPQ